MAETFLEGHQLGVPFVPVIPLWVVPSPQKTHFVETASPVFAQSIFPGVRPLPRHPFVQPALQAILRPDVALAMFFLVVEQGFKHRVPKLVGGGYSRLKRLGQGITMASGQPAEAQFVETIDPFLAQAAFLPQVALTGNPLAKKTVLPPVAGHIAMAAPFLEGHQLGESFVPIIPLRVVPAPQKTHFLEAPAPVFAQQMFPGVHPLLRHPFVQPALQSILRPDVAMALLLFVLEQGFKHRIPKLIRGGYPWLKRLGRGIAMAAGQPAEAQLVESVDPFLAQAAFLPQVALTGNPLPK